MPGQRAWTATGLVCLLAAMIALWALQITERPIEKDAAQTVRMAVNLAHDGVISMRRQPPLTPTNYREPIPVFVTSVGVHVIDALLGPAETGEAYTTGKRVKLLKYQNLIWLTLVAAGAMFAMRLFGGQPLFVAVAMVAVSLPYLRLSESEVDALLTELPAAAFFIWGSCMLAAAFRDPRIWRFVLAGVLLGGFALVKAIGLYVFAGLIVALGVIYAWARRGWPLRDDLRNVLWIVVGFVCVVTPWMLRNQAELGAFQITQRSGVALMYRAEYDRMTPTEYRGAFYVWAPNAFVQSVAGKVLGFAAADLNHGGRLQRLNMKSSSDFAKADMAAEAAGDPDRATSFYRKARAERTKMQMSLQGTDEEQRDLDADARLSQKAAGEIRANVGRHLLVTIPVMWRGAAVLFPVLAIALIYGAARRREDFVVFVLPATGAVALLAVATEFDARFGLPVRPVAMIAATVLAQVLWNALRKPRRQRHDTHDAGVREKSQKVDAVS